MRKRTPLYLSKGGLLTALIAALYAPHAFAIPAGRVDFVQGAVSATGSDGSARALAKGADINSGDIITIGEGRAQIRFSDGSYLALQPNTIFKVDQYAFEGKVDGSEKGFFSLLKGGLRTISGLIGKGNRQNYKLSTPTATIGIRGTAFSAQQTGEQLRVTVNEGRVAITNQGGSLTIGSGQSVIVNSPSSGPQMTDQPVPAVSGLQPQQNQQQEQATGANAGSPFVSGNQLTSSGLPLVVPSPSVPPPSTPPVPILTTGSGYAIAYSYSGNGNSYNVTGLANPATFNAGQILTGFTGSGGSLNFTPTGTNTPDSGSDGIIGWGRWIGTLSGTAPGSGNYATSNEGLSYVVGLPTLQANLPASGSAIYTLVGATSPSTFNGSFYSLGNFAGTATVVFGVSPTLTLNATITNSALFPNPYNLANFGAIPLSFMAGANAEFSGFATASGASPMSGASININGLFAGSVGERLGLAYSINKFGTLTTGSAAFKTP